MRQLNAFIRKEIIELTRSNRLVILLIIFLVFGIMGPAMAKLTPWILEMSADSLAESGITITIGTVDALSSWTQFYKNISLAIIIFIILVSGTLTMEYQKGTLVNIFTKGMARWKVIAAKTTVIMAFWTVCYFLCYGVCYAYTVYFWDNSIATHCFAAAMCPYLFGIWVIALIILLSVIFKTNMSVLAGVGAIVIISYLLGIVPTLSKYLPTQLLSSGNVLTNKVSIDSYLSASIVAIAMIIVAFAIAIPIFNKKKI